MIETPMLTVEESARRDAFVRRLFQAIVEGGNLVTIYLGNHLGLYQALDKLGSLTPSELCTGYFCHPFRYPFARVTRWSFITFLCCCGMWYPTEEGVTNLQNHRFNDTDDSITSFFAPVIHQAESDTVAHVAVYCSVLEQIP